MISDRITSIANVLESTTLDSMLGDINKPSILSISSNDIRYVISKKYIDFAKAIGQLGGKLKYIKSGSTGHTFKAIHENIEKPSYAVKIVAYTKKENYGDMYFINRPENTEILMLKLLSYFVLKQQTPHIVLPIVTFNTSIKPFLSLTENRIIDNKKYNQFIERYNKGDYYNNVSVLISEWANGGDLLDFLKKKYLTLTLKMWKTIFFQIISTLAVIQNKYPSFRHNDMKANNILVHTDGDDVNSTSKYLYKINGKTYIIPDINLQVKLWDFDFACIPEILNNSKVNAEWTKKINIKPVQNRYYDIHYFFNTLIKKGFLPDLLTNSKIPKEVTDFINRIVPDKYKEGDNISDRGRLLVNDEYLIPDDIIKNDTFFECFKS
jgi:hypothetical protein